MTQENSIQELTEYDDKGNWIHYQDAYGLEQWRILDDRGNTIVHYDNKGNEDLTEYDETGHEKHFISLPDFHEWWRDDDLGLYYFHDGKGSETFREKDISGKLIVRFYLMGGVQRERKEP